MSNGVSQCLAKRLESMSSPPLKYNQHNLKIHHKNNFQTRYSVCITHSHQVFLGQGLILNHSLVHFTILSGQKSYSHETIPLDTLENLHGWSKLGYYIEGSNRYKNVTDRHIFRISVTMYSVLPQSSYLNEGLAELSLTLSQACLPVQVSPVQNSSIDDVAQHLTFWFVTFHGKWHCSECPVLWLFGTRDSFLALPKWTQ